MGIKIVEYNDTYAAKVADMWNKSASNWGNDDKIRTEQDVINEEARHSNLALYLATDSEEVVGYCSFSEYTMDDGASYLPLLNVRPDYHGKKVGKKLILRVLEDAIKSEWPRFDLFTWSGNHKAVPLYKKCGFFWENKTDSVHLMNFIPYVMKTEAVKDYFNLIDWYKDSIRPIELSPDGRKESDFDFYEYTWKKDNINLRMEFERKGRGLRLIETDDYLIKASIDKQGLVFGYNYKIKYEIVNKSGKELKVELKGLDDKNIKYDMKDILYVKDSNDVEGEFFVGKVDESQNEWKTHPTVSTEIKINGKEALFKVGIEPKFPIKAKLRVPNKSNKLNIEYDCFLDIENGFDKECTVSFNMPSNEDVVFDNKIINLKLDSKQKKSIPLKYKVNKFCIFKEKINYVINVDGKENKYSREVSGIFKGSKGKYYGKIEDDYVIVNGEYVAVFEDSGKYVLLMKDNLSNLTTGILPVKLGLPYSLEFTKLNPETVDYEIENDIVRMNLDFNSRDFQGLKVTIVCELSASGILESYYKIRNFGEKRNNIKLIKRIFHRMNDTYIPYDNDILHIKGSDGSSMSYYDNSKFDENWLFSDNNEFTIGVCWNKNDNGKLISGSVSIENDIGQLENSEVYKTESVYISLGHKDYKDFRKFATEKFEVSERKEIGIIDYQINDGNPFVKDDFTVEVKNNRKSSFEGSLTVNGITKEIDENSVSLKVDNNSKVEKVKKLKLQLDLKDRYVNKEFIVFGMNESKINSTKEIIEGKEVYIVDNGIIKIKSSPEFSDSLYSLEYDEHEWLDSTFPVPKQKAWWNPWVGGINVRPQDMQDNAMLLENINCEFISIDDNYDSTWSGIKISVDIQKDEKNKGIKIENYYLMLPGSKVLLTTSEIVQNSGKYIDEKGFNRIIDLNIKELSDSKYTIKKNDEVIKYKCGDVNIFVKELGMLTTESERDSKIIIFNSWDNYVMGHTEDGINLVGSSNRLSIPDGSSKFTANDFIIFSDDYLDKSMIVNLKNIKLKKD